MASKEQTHSNDKARVKQRLPKPTTIESLDVLAQQQSHPGTLIQRARSDLRSLTPSDVLQFQHTIGNQAVGQLVADAGPTHPTVQRNPKLVIQRTVTQDHFAQATQIAGPVQAHAPNVNIVVVPDGVMLGAGGNPAIFVTKQLHVKLVRDGIAAHPQDINVDQALLDVGVNRTVVIKEEVLNYPQARRAAVIWHEYGHAENGPAESGAYLFEVQQLIRAVDENRLQSDEVNEVIESRLDQYAMGMTDPLQTFLDGWKRRRAGEWPYNE